VPVKMLLERLKRPKFWSEIDTMAAVLLVFILVVVMTCFDGCSRIAHAGPIPDNLAVKAVYNEALHDTRSLDAMCHALRNRKSLVGVYGLRVKRPIPPKEYAKTLKTWQRSLSTPDVTKGATHWLSDYDLKHCRPAMMAWRFKMVETLYCGKTHFYREV